MIDKKLEMHLAGEVEAANKATTAFNEYFAEFFDDKEKSLITAFRETKVGDSDSLLRIHMLFKSIDALKLDLITKIETGSLAQAQLVAEKEKENDN